MSTCAAFAGGSCRTFTSLEPMRDKMIGLRGLLTFSCALVLTMISPAKGTEQATPIEATGVTPAVTPMPEAPFGLTWLSSKEQVAALVGRLDKPFPTDFGESYVVSDLPKGLADLNYAVLSFDNDDRLIRITAIG